MDARALFAQEFAHQRKTAGLTQAVVADRAGWSIKTIQAVEQRRCPPSPGLGAAADAMFGLNGTLERAEAFARSGASPFDDFVEREQAATRIRTYDLRLVPGLLQTADYARAVIARLTPWLDVDEEVTIRIRRQRVLDRARVRAVVDESALYRVAGRRQVQRAQLAHLLDAGSRVAIQVMPLDAALHPGLTGPLTILSCVDEPGVACAEGRGIGELIDAPEDVARAATAYDAIVAAALPEDVSAEMITAIMEDL